MLPTYPDFQKISIDHKRDIEQITNKFRPYSDFNFVSLFCWNTSDSLEASILHNNLVIKMPDYVTSKDFYTFIGETNVDETVKTLLTEANELRLVPEEVVKNLRSTENLLISDDRDNYDYILSAPVLAELKGGHFLEKRRLRNNFIKEFGGSLRVEPIDITDEKIKDQIRKMITLWADIKGDQANENELIAIDKMLNHAGFFDLKSLAIYVDDEMLGFIINEHHSNDSVVSHFSKTDVSMTGATAYLVNENGKYLTSLGYEYINYEQDLGLPGLRKSKTLWQPVDYLRKYTIKLKPEVDV